MQYTQPYGITDTNAGYINGNPAAGIAGSIPPAAAIEFPQRDLANFISDNSLTPTNNDVHQVSKALQNSTVIFGIDTGSANYYAITLNPIPDAIIAGMSVRVLLANTNTGPSNLTVSGHTNGIHFMGGDVPAGVLQANTAVQFLFNGTYWDILAGGAVAGSRPTLAADRTYFVDGGIGSDTLYNGLAPAIAAPYGPFKTIQHAVDVISQLELNGHNVTVQVADWGGLYAQFIVGYRVNGSLLFQGNTTTPQNVKIGAIGAAGAGAPTAGAYGAGVTFTMIGFQFTSTALGVALAAQVGGAYVAFGACDFAAYPAGGIHLLADTGGLGGMNAPYNWYSISGGTGYHMAANGGSGALIITPSSNQTITLVGNPNFAGAFCWVDSNSYARFWTRTTFSGAATGTKFICTANGVINTHGAGASYLPGSIAGVYNTGGQYL
jgi:hypothetical protein